MLRAGLFAVHTTRRAPAPTRAHPCPALNRAPPLRALRCRDVKLVTRPAGPLTGVLGRTYK